MISRFRLDKVKLLKTQLVKAQIISTSFLLVVFAVVGSAGCASKVEDPRREAMVASLDRLKPVLRKSLQTDPARIIPIAKLAELGLSDPDDEKGQRLRELFKKEFQEDIPENLMDPEKSVGDIVRYVAESKYGVDLNEQRAKEAESTLLRPEVRDKLKEEEVESVESGDDSFTEIDSDLTAPTPGSTDEGIVEK